MTEYSDYERETAPPWLQGKWAQRWFYVSGLTKDAWRDAAKRAVKARFVELAPRDALAPLLRDYALDEPYNEPEAVTRSRIARAWETWGRAGTKGGLLAALGTAGYRNVEIKEHREWNAGRWWDFWIILKPPFPWDSALASVVKFGRAWRWGDATRFAAATPDGERARVLALVTKWKPAHANLVHVGVLLRGKLWGDGWRFGDGQRLGGAMALWRT